MTMQRTDANDDFFVGYSSRIPARILRFLAIVTASLLVLAGILAFALGAGTTDPGSGRFIGGNRNLQNLTGLVDLNPYPILRVLPTETGGARAIPLVGLGKFGVGDAAAPLDGQLVDVKGFFLRRGPLDMLTLRGWVNNVALHASEADLSASQRAFEPAEAVPLGRWRLTGEICDGKCYAGAMRPGDGLAHRACAELCLVGGVPPVFVSTGEVAGISFFWMADADGGPLPDEYLDLVALRIELEGNVERRDDILIFKVDLSTAKVF